MAKFLLKVESSGLLASFQTAPTPPDYLIELLPQVEGLSAAAALDGLDHWLLEVQVSGSIGDWAKGAAFDALWNYLELGVHGLEVRPRGSLSVRGRTDPRRVGVSFRYLGDQELRRVRDGLREKIEAGFDPVAKRLRADIELQY